jgi:predicted metal-binding membrane protein
MVAMMLPSSLPMLLLYRRVALFRGEPHAGALTALVAAAYFVVWTIFGAIAYTAGVSIATAAMGSALVSHLVPAGAGIALIAAGLYQLSRWKSTCLRRCRDPLDVLSQHLHRGWRGAAALGVHHGLFCTGCCWALMLMQLVVGVMNLAAMVVVALVIGLEKLAPRGETLARAVGAASIGGGVFLLARDAVQMVRY